MKRISRLAVSALLLCLLPLIVLAAPVKNSAVFDDSFDTIISFIAFTDTDAEFAAASQLLHDEYLRLDHLYSTYDSYEADGIISVFTLNERAALAPVEVDEDLFSLLRFCKENYAMTCGKTNIAMGAVLSIWHTYREAGLDAPEMAVLPPMDLLTAANEHVSMDDLILDEAARTVYYADPELKLDLGAVAKGYATEIIAKKLMASGVTSFIISAGGNVRVAKAPLDGRPAWGVGLQDPDRAYYDTSAIVDALFLTDKSVVTSGDYQRFYTVNGVNYCHLINPDTLMPDSDFHAVTIITEDSGLADMLSTAAYLMPQAQSEAFIDSLPEVEAIWIMKDGSIRYTEGAKPYSRNNGATNTAK